MGLCQEKGLLMLCLCWENLVKNSEPKITSLDQVPREFICLALRQKGVPEYLVNIKVVKLLLNFCGSWGPSRICFESTFIYHVNTCSDRRCEGWFTNGVVVCRWSCFVCGIIKGGYGKGYTSFVKVWMYVSIKVVSIKYWQVMVYLRKLMSKVFFLRHFTTNYIFTLSTYNLQWKIIQWKNFSYWKYMITTNQKVKILWFCMCACGCGCNWMCLRE